MSENEYVSLREVFAWAVLTASVVAVAVLTADVPARPEIYDVEVERQLARSAWEGQSAEYEVARTPGGLFLGLPWLLATDAVAAATVVNIVCLGLIAVAIVRLADPSRLITILLIVGLPGSILFRQAIFHASPTLPILAALLWGWVWVDERPAIAGILWGIAGVARLWPFLLLLAVRNRRVKWWMVSCTVGLTIFGLLLPGVSLEKTAALLTRGNSAWIAASHNGSAASWLTDLGTTEAAMIGGGVVLVIWTFGIRLVEDRIAWTIPAAILASPLAWVPYLIVVVPVLLRQRWLAAMSGILLVFLWPLVPDQVMTTGLGLLAMFAAARPLERLEEDAPADLSI